MTPDANIHAAQVAILRELLFVPAASFAKLQKPTGLASNHFNFHIARLVELGLVQSTPSGQYALTIAGKEYANRLDTDERTVERQGKVTVLVAPIRTRPDDGQTEYLIQKRLKQPFYGLHGFMSGKLRWGETVLAGAARELEEEMGLTAKLAVKAIYHKLDYTTDGRLLEDKHFYIVQARQPRGDLLATFEGGENAWYTLEALMALEKKFPGVDRVAQAATARSVQFIEQAYTHNETDY